MKTSNELLGQDAIGIFRRPEGHILLTGIALLAFAILWSGLSWWWSPEYCRKITSLAFTRFVIGRPGGVYFGHVLQFDYLTNIIVNYLVDVLIIIIAT